MSERILEDQKDYYRARAPEYDDWFFRKGRYDRGEPWNSMWTADCQAVRDALKEFQPHGDILELAAGTGNWTRELARSATTLTAVDASPEALALNRSKVDAGAPVQYLVEDVFTWEPAARYDLVFFGFWLSHVPDSHFQAFWSLVERALKPDGRVFFVDSRYEATSTSEDHKLPDPGSSVSRRLLNDGRAFDIVKVYYHPRELERRLLTLGWTAEVRETPTYFIYGHGVRTPA